MFKLPVLRCFVHSEDAHVWAGWLIGTMEKAAVVLEKLISSIDEVIVEDDSFGSTDADRLKDVRRNSIGQHFDMPENVSIATPPDPVVTVETLRTYSSVLRLFELSDKDAGIDSADTFSKYLFSAYVYRATGQFHDEEVSALMSISLTSCCDGSPRCWKCSVPFSLRGLERNGGSIHALPSSTLTANVLSKDLRREMLATPQI